MTAIDPNEIGRWFEAEAASLVLYARQWFDLSEAEDVVQEAFVRLMQQDHRPRHVKAWLYRVVRNESMSRLRTQIRRRRREQAASELQPAYFEAKPADLLDAGIAEHVLESLVSDEREIITLRIWGGLTLEQTAGVTGLSVPTVFRKYRAALSNLRKRLEMPCTKNPL